MLHTSIHHSLSQVWLYRLSLSLIPYQEDFISLFYDYLCSVVEVLSKPFYSLVYGTGPIFCLPIRDLFDHVGFAGCIQFEGAISSWNGFHVLREGDLTSEVVIVLVVLKPWFRGEDESARLLHEEAILLSQLPSLELFDLLYLFRDAWLSRLKDLLTHLLLDYFILSLHVWVCEFLSQCDHRCHLYQLRWQRSIVCWRHPMLRWFTRIDHSPALRYLFLLLRVLFMLLNRRPTFRLNITLGLGFHGTTKLRSLLVNDTSRSNWRFQPIQVLPVYVIKERMLLQSFVVPTTTQNTCS